MFSGALGTLARFGVYEAARRLPWGSLPLATIIVNVSGSFAFGVVWAAAEGGRLSPQTRLAVLSGFMGAFTTFSTFAFETGQMLREGRPWAAAGIIAANNVLGIGAFLLGEAIGRRM